jgi:hypothetical protein
MLANLQKNFSDEFRQGDVARPVGEGKYAIVKHQTHAELAYIPEIPKSDPTCINFTSSGARPRLVQNVLLSRIVALIIKVLVHFPNTSLQYKDTSSGFNSTLITS